MHSRKVCKAEAGRRPASFWGGVAFYCQAPLGRCWPFCHPSGAILFLEFISSRWAFAFIYSPQIFTEYLLSTGKCWVLCKLVPLPPPKPLLHTRTYTCMHAHTCTQNTNPSAAEAFTHSSLAPTVGFLVLPRNLIAPEFPPSKHFLTLYWNCSFISLSPMLSVNCSDGKVCLGCQHRLGTQHSAWYTHGSDIP